MPISKKAKTVGIAMNAVAKPCNLTWRYVLGWGSQIPEIPKFRNLKIPEISKSWNPEILKTTKNYEIGIPKSLKYQYGNWGSPINLLDYLGFRGLLQNLFTLIWPLHHWSVLDFWKISWKNQVRRTRFLVYFELYFYCLYSLQKTIWKLIFSG